MPGIRQICSRQAVHMQNLTRQMLFMTAATHASHANMHFTHNMPDNIDRCCCTCWGDPMRPGRFNSEPMADPYRGLASDEAGLDSARPSVQSSGELIPNVDPARAKWAQKGDLSWPMLVQSCHRCILLLQLRQQSPVEVLTASHPKRVVL